VIDDNKVPPRPTERQLGDVERAYCCNADLPGLVIVVTPPGSTPEYDTGLICGHHFFATVSDDGATGIMPAIDIPYGHIRKTRGCGWGLKQGIAGALSVLAGHEWAETITDPFPNTSARAGLGTGWATGGRGRKSEVADLCEPVVHPRSAQRNVFLLKLRTGTFVMQKLWSNAVGRLGKCVEAS